MVVFVVRGWSIVVCVVGGWYEGGREKGGKGERWDGGCVCGQGLVSGRVCGQGLVGDRGCGLSFGSLAQQRISPKTQFT